MPSTSHLHSLKFLIDHEKTQELIGRYVEILHSEGNAEAMYPDVADHLSVCRDCRSMFDDLSASLSAQDDSETSLRQSILDRFAGIVPSRSPINETPLTLAFREDVLLRIAHALPEVEFPPSGLLLFYDTLAVENLEVMALFTLHREEQPGYYHVEGIIYPEQAPFRFRASLEYPSGKTEARIEDNHLVFDPVPLDVDAGHLTVALEGYTRWQAD